MYPFHWSHNCGFNFLVVFFFFNIKILGGIIVLVVVSMGPDLQPKMLGIFTKADHKQCRLSECFQKQKSVIQNIFILFLRGLQK